MEISDYIKQINEQFKTGNAREHSYRPMLQQLLTDMLPGYVVTNEPARISCGAPDYIITRKDQPIFFIEAKDLNDGDLDGRNQHKEQFNRYKESLDHIIFTDYLDFHLYENGEWQRNVRIGEIQGNNIRLLKDNVKAFEELVAHIASTKPTPITSASKLAQQMAAKARTLASTIKEAFRLAEEGNEEARQANQQLQSQLEAFRRVLIHDLKPDSFADLYAQTIAYGMFAARLHDNTPEDFSRHEAANLIPKSNPFLRQIFQSIAGYDLDERIAWVIDDLVSIFLVTDINKVMKNYASNGLHHDPMIHFYEDFLSAYDSSLRKAKGVWYTPQPVVQFIVRAVDEILQRDFGLADGLADYSIVTREIVNEAYVPGEKVNGKERPKTIKQEMHRVQILDPATGTGTFLAETVNQIYDKFRGMQGMWQGYVTEHLIPRLHGFELLMASYAVAHLKLDMLLQETGYKQTETQKRLKIYLTNSLEECHPDTDTLWSSWLSNEANEANHIKRDCPVMVMMGNPPYSGISQNHGAWILNLLKDYKYEPNSKTPLKERKIWLDDDYVKFIRLAQDYLTRSGEGVLAFINNNGFIDNPTFRGMRWSLLESFDEIYILNLHGNSMKKETSPNGGKDENVFDIRVGVSVNIFVKTGKKQAGGIAKVYYKDLFGKRNDKYEYLSTKIFSQVDFQEIEIQQPLYFFCPMNNERKEEYERGIGIDKIMPINVTGIVTMGDTFAISDTTDGIKSNITDLLCNNYSASQLKEKYSLGKNYPDFILESKNKGMIFEDDKVIQILYRPFDILYTYYDNKIIWRTRDEVNKHVLRPNMTIIVSRQAITDNWSHVLVTPYLCDNRTFYSNKGITQACPLYLYTNTLGVEEKVPNLNPVEWQKFNDVVGRETTPEELLAYIYAVLHSPSYRERYKEFLKVDFPRIPLPASVAEFERLGNLGQRLIDLHLLKTPQIETTFPIAGDQRVEKNTWVDGNVWINDTQYFGNVPEATWNAYIGGYQPAQKWLKDRKGRTLSFAELKHYQHIIYALSQTIQVMQEIG